MIDVYDKNGNKVTLTDSNDLSHKTDFTKILNNDESIGKTVIERVIHILKQYSPSGFIIITVYGGTMCVLGDSKIAGNGYGAYIAYYYFENSIYLIKVQNGNYTYTAIS